MKNFNYNCSQCWRYSENELLQKKIKNKLYAGYWVEKYIKTSMNKIPSNYGMCFHTFLLFSNIQRSPNFVHFLGITVILCYDYGTWRSVERKFDQNLVTSCTRVQVLVGSWLRFAECWCRLVCRILVPFVESWCRLCFFGILIPFA